MSEEPRHTVGYPVRRRSTAVASIVNTFELLITALILAFVFRAFVAEAFRIPTGSMAETLRGSHYNLRCIRCGHPFAIGGDRDSWSRPQPRCPSCAHILPSGMGVSVSNGDRILVLKCMYQFLPPQRWDVLVFKNPVDPRENYIKRLIASPGETLEIVEGDIYIDGRIARKPPKVQEALWMPVYNNDYQSIRHGRVLPGGGGTDELTIWRQPFEKEPNSLWNLNAKGPTVFAIQGRTGRLHWLKYNDQVASDFRASYAYNNGAEHDVQPICSDLMIRFDVTNVDGEGVIGASLSANGIEFRAAVDLTGTMMLGKMDSGGLVELARMQMDAVKPGSDRRFQFANVDRQLVFSFGDKTLRHDLGSARVDVDAFSRGTPPSVAIFGDGALTLWHIALFRDVHYVDGHDVGERIARAAEGSPFTLGPDEYFVCGDNSPSSLDSRLWATEGIGNGGRRYAAGVVPKDYLMGKAFFVYWSDAFRPSENLWPIVPNIGGLKLIHGGSDKVF